MSLAATISAMVVAGCSPQQLEAVVLAHLEAEKARGPRSLSPALRRAVLERDGFKCSYCGAEDVPLHCDHIQPYSRGGATSLENLAAACKSCNSSKKDRTIVEWRR